jgi:glycerophosphoryl diester phosphodiesterase
VKRPKNNLQEPKDMNIQTILILTIVLSGLSFFSNPIQAGSARVHIVAHRGASSEAPENTLASFRLGWQQTEAVENDIYLSKDGRIVVIHDGDTKRVAGVDKKVEDQTLAQLKALDVGRWKDPKWTGERIPTLEEVLAAMPPKKWILVEIKCGPQILPELKRVIEQSKLSPDQIVIQSFSFDVCAAAKKKFPKHKVFFLCGFQKDKKTGAWSPTFQELIDPAKKAGLDGLAVGYSERVNSDFVQQMKKANLTLFVWTVDDPAAAQQAKNLGVNGIITNCPGLMHKQLK